MHRNRSQRGNLFEVAKFQFEEKSKILLTEMSESLVFLTVLGGPETFYFAINCHILCCSRRRGRMEEVEQVAICKQIETLDDDSR